MPPIYDPEAVRPMWEELVQVGFQPLHTPDEVSAAINSESEGIALTVINSVCGCAAGSCRPGVMLGLQNAKIPDKLYTVFAGVDTEATQEVRALLGEIPPSSPNIILFRHGKPIWALQRHHIEMMSATDVSRVLREAFDEFCSKPGPSIPEEEFDKINPVQECGSSIPLYPGD